MEISWDSLVGRILACHAEDAGSSPAPRSIL